VEKQADGGFLVDASMEVDRFTQAFGFELPEGDFDTLGGFLSSLAGHLPDVGERFTYAGWQFTVAAKEAARIDRVRIIRLKGGTTGKDKDKDKEGRPETRPESSPTAKA
jgi:CBS domain containing-hemolysin-like protein